MAPAITKGQTSVRGYLNHNNNNNNGTTSKTNRSVKSINETATTRGSVESSPSQQHNNNSNIISNNMIQPSRKSVSSSSSEAATNISKSEKFTTSATTSNGLQNGDIEKKSSIPKGCEIFVDKIPRDCREQDVRPIFESIGAIEEMRIMSNGSGISRGFGFIRYQTREVAKRAVKEFNNFEIRPNKFLSVILSVDNRKLWISGIPKNCTAEEIKAEMELMTDGVLNVILYTSQMDKSKTRGYAFVEYESHKAAALARRKLVSEGRVCLLGHEIDKVDWAEPENEVDEEIMATVKVLFIRNLMPSTSEESIRRLFNDMINAAGSGCVERVKKLKDYAFVHFVSRQAAEVAFQNASNGLTIDGSRIEVAWSKPVDKHAYNIRKQLTKVLSSPHPQPIQTFPFPPVAHESGFANAMTPAGPRRRGAAGIRGLGAPGTVPVRGMVRRYVPGSLDGGYMFNNNKFIRSLMASPCGYPPQSFPHEFSYNDLSRPWNENPQLFLYGDEHMHLGRHFYQAGYQGDPLTLAATMYAASAALNGSLGAGGFFPANLGPNGFIIPPPHPPPCMTMMATTESANSLPDMDHMASNFLDLSLNSNNSSTSASCSPVH